MIHTIRTVTVDSKKSVIDSPIVLYRGDREVEIEFSLVGSKFTFSEGGNVIKSLNAAYGQLIIHSPNPNIDIVFSEITECNDGKVVFLITKEMIDELVEVGTYDFQIRLYDATQVSRATIPPISQALDIRHPMGSEEETNVVDIAIAEYSVVRDDPFEEVMTFLPSGDYNKTEWSSNALITAARMNKIEDGLYTVNRNMEVSDTNLFNRIEKVNNNLSARLNNLGDEIATEAMDSFSDQIAQLKGTVNASILASETKVTAEMDATKESVNAELEAFEETVNVELELTRNTVEETKAAIDEAKVTVDETQSVVTELIDETRETVSSFEGVINNLDAAYKAADATLQNNIDVLDAAYKAADVEIQNSIPTKISQLENDASYATEEYVQDTARHNMNLIRNSGFAGALANIGGKYVRNWNIQGSLKVYQIPYTSDGKLRLTPTAVHSSGSIYQNIYITESFAGAQLTWSFYCDWQKNIEPPLYNIDVFNTSVENVYHEREYCTKGNNTITFTIPYVGNLSYISIGIVTYNGLVPDNGGSFVEMYVSNMKLEYGDKVTPWCPHPQDNLLIAEPKNWFNCGTPIVNPDGVMEIGKFLDFHATNDATNDYTARIYNTNAGSLHFNANLYPDNNNSRNLGKGDYRWQTVFSVNALNVSSDRSMKENISYVKSRTRTSSQITYDDMYNFVKNDLELAEYNFKGNDERKMNFIAQDLLYNLDGTDNKIGQMIVHPVAPPTEEEVEEAKAKLEEGQEYIYPTLSYDTGMYISVLAGALKESLNKIDKLEARIDELENK